MSTAVVVDADTLFGATTRALLIQLAYSKLLSLHWSDLILDELSRALVRTGRKPSIEDAKRHERLLNSSLPHARIRCLRLQRHYELIQPLMRSAKDTHVAACAYERLRSRDHLSVREVVVLTRNVADFKVHELKAVGIVVRRPDAFLLDLTAAHRTQVQTAFTNLRRSLVSNPSVSSLLERLTADGQRKTAAALGAFAHSLV